MPLTPWAGEKSLKKGGVIKEVTIDLVLLLTKGRLCVYLRSLLLAIDGQQLHCEDQGAAAGNFRARATCAITQGARDDEAALLAWAHVQQALIPAFNHLPLSKGEVKGAPTNAGVELGAVLEQSASVLHT
jgi:hypothetical protein